MIPRYILFSMARKIITYNMPYNVEYGNQNQAKTALKILHCGSERRKKGRIFPHSPDCPRLSQTWPRLETGESSSDQRSPCGTNLPV